jgi:diguanylate cyclase (GGDEF)-like protein
MKRRITTAALVGWWLSGALSLWAQHYSFQPYTDENGLTNLVVHCLLQDSAGFIWVGTENGLFRYDGHQFVAFSREQGLRNVMISSLHETADGVLWVASYAGLFRVDGERINPALPVMPWEVRYRSTMASDRRDRLLVATSRGLLIGNSPQKRGDPREFHFYSNPKLPSGEAVSSVYVDADGVVWFSSGAKLCQLAGAELKIAGMAEGVPPLSWKAIKEDRYGRLWISGPQGAWVREPHSSRFSAKKLMPGWSHGFLDLNERGEILIPTDQGIGRWDGEQWDVLKQANGLPGDSVCCALTDHEGSLWIGMMGTGLIRSRSYTEWESWTSSEGLHSDQVWAIQRDDRGRIWVATNAGIEALPKGSQPVFAPLPGGSRSGSAAVISLIRGPHGTLWAGTLSGQVIRIEEAGGSTLSYGRESGLTGTNLLIVLSLFMDTSEKLWVATTEGLFRADIRVNPIRFTLISTGTSSEREMVHQITQDDEGAVWVAGRAGLGRWRAGLWTRWSEANGLRGDHVSAVAKGNDSELWIAYGQQKGVSRLRFGPNEKLQIDHFSRENRLHSDRINFIGRDRRGWMWIGGDRGVDVFDGTTWQYFDRAQGLVWNDCNDNSFYADSDGSVWLGTSRGLAHFRPRATPLPKPSPRVVITAASWGSHLLAGGPVAPVYPYEAQPLVISFAALSYHNPAAVKFRYRLAGLDPNWVETDAHEVRYANLPSGSYSFEVLARSADLVWSATPASIALRVRSQWWRTWWFDTLLAATAVFAGWRLWVSRTTHLTRRQKVLEEAVQERTRQLQELATTDSLTGVRNRRAIFEFLSKELARGERSGGPLTVIMADLDCFKKINDLRGHAAGDAVLRETAQRLKSALRTSDAIGRYGGEEFLIVLTDCDGDSASSRADGLRAIIGSRPISFGNQEIVVTCSFGISWTKSRRYNLTQLLHQADAALYSAKRAGKNRVAMADDCVGVL